MTRARKLLALTESTDYSKCPVCRSANITDTTETSTYPDSIEQDYTCEDCGSGWTIEYHPVQIFKIVKGNKDD